MENNIVNPPWSTSEHEEKMQQRNNAVLNTILNLEYNWNNNCGEPFKKELVEKCRKIMKGLTVQPDIYPTGQDSIQFEWEGLEKSYLEVEFYMNSFGVFLINEKGQESEYGFAGYKVEEVIKILNEEIENFYKGENEK